MSRFYDPRAWLLSATALALSVPLSSGAFAHPKAHVESWGHLDDGRKVKAITLRNDHGISATLLSYGAIIHAVNVPDRRGRIENIALGFPNLAGYIKHNNDPHFGAALGRVANRIANASFTLEGKTYHISANNAPNTLHGGAEGFDRKLWSIERTGEDADGAYVVLKLVSPDGDQGFPGALTTYATYRLGNDDTLSLNFKAQTDAPTVVNLSTHNYWNLNGEGSGGVEPEEVQIFADHFVQTDENSIPTGIFTPVEGTAFDFRHPHTVGERLRSREPQMAFGMGYDKCYVLNAPSKAGGEEHLAARVSDPRSGRVLDISTNMPGLQFYTANHIYGTYYGTAGKAYRQGDALAFEPEFYPNSPNQGNFPSIELKPGQSYDYSMSFHFTHE